MSVPKVPATQDIVVQNVYGRIIVMDSITFSDERNNSGDVLVGASFCGMLSIRWPLRVDPKGVIAHEAGPGLNQAGINGLWALEGKGIPGAAAATHSCRIADGHDMYENGVVGACNDRARLLGISEGMPIKEAARLMLERWPSIPDVYKPIEVAHTSPRGRVVAMGSVTFITEENAGDVICAGSHFGRTSAAYSSRFNLRGVLCSDAGRSKDDSGISGLEVLQEKGVPGAAVSTDSAEIGDGLSTYRDGIVSAHNAVAAGLGIRDGMPAKEAALLMLERDLPRTVSSHIAPTVAKSDKADYSAWIGRTEERTDYISPSPLARLSAALDHADGQPPDGATLPPLAHWLFFLPDAPQSEIGRDGHPKRGGFLPPVNELPRRMWAGSRISFPGSVSVGQKLSRKSTIASVKHKEGANGPLVFVTVRHEVGPVGATPAIVEEQDLVFRGVQAPAAKADIPKAEEGAWRRELTPDPVLLFRYSALTFNGHRIHFDREYTTREEGYPGLVVQGPLIAMLLVDLVRRHAPGARVASFSFRAVSPLFDGNPMSVNANPPGPDGVVKLWAANHAGGLAMTAEATLA
ncbi:MAG TPA: MaoC family dehydratase N-terminal domain-containing protein [Rhizobiaceae bacterium]|nr:MaoC family dehydratase N-terminal domain-containing protein [Rhizobiaceae bacterium]